MGDLIDREAFLKQERKKYCEDCDRRKGMKNGKMTFCYEIGEAPCRACWLDDALGDLEDFPTAPRWVRCEERLPDIAEKVLVYNRWQIFTAWRTSFSKPIGEWDSYDFQTDNITHWMPLPEPPKEGE